jgi:hypothetical protein
MCLQYIYPIVGSMNRVEVKIQPSTFTFDGKQLSMKRVRNNYELLLITEADPSPQKFKDMDAFEMIKSKKDEIAAMAKWEHKNAPAPLHLAFQDANATKLLILGTDATSKFNFASKDNSKDADKYFARNMAFKIISLDDEAYDSHCLHWDKLNNKAGQVCKCTILDSVLVDKICLAHIDENVVKDIKIAVTTLRVFRDNIALLIYLICMCDESCTNNPLIRELDSKEGIPLTLGFLSPRAIDYVTKHLQTRICASPRYNQLKTVYQKCCEMFGFEKASVNTHSFDQILQAAFSQTPMIFFTLIGMNKKKMPEGSMPNLWHSIYNSVTGNPKQQVQQSQFNFGQDLDLGGNNIVDPETGIVYQMDEDIFKDGPPPPGEDYIPLKTRRTNKRKNPSSEFVGEFEEEAPQPVVEKPDIIDRVAELYLKGVQQ